MMKQFLFSSGLLLLSAGSAWAIAPECGPQLAQIKAQLADQPAAQQKLSGKFQEAEQLCADNKEMEAQQLARELRQEMGTMSGSGSSTTGGSPTTGGGSGTQSDD